MTEATKTDITTVEIGREPYTTTVATGAHTLTADEPGAMGGADKGPDPYGLLLSSLGACKAITVRMYADRKGWDLERVRLGLAHSRPDGRGAPERIDISISFEGDLDDDQRAKLKEIAAKCPVEHTITGELTVETILE